MKTAITRTGQGNVDGLSTFMNELPVGLSGIVEEAQTLDRYLPNSFHAPPLVGGSFQNRCRE